MASRGNFFVIIQDAVPYSEGYYLISFKRNQSNQG